MKQQQQNQPESTLSRPPLVSKPLNSTKSFDGSKENQPNNIIQQPLAEKNAYKLPAPLPPARDLVNLDDCTEKENSNPYLPESFTFPKRTGRASICTTTQRVPMRSVPPRRNSLIPLPSSTTVTKFVPPLPSIAADDNENVDGPESCIAPVVSDSPKRSNGGEKKLMSALRRSLSKKNQKKSPTQQAQQIRKIGGLKLETEFIKEIVTNINEQLRAPLRSTLPQDLIGMDDSIKSITSWLNDDGSSHTADVLTIWGMGGIGKTSLARLIYDVHSTKFKPSSFIGDISRKCKDKYNGLLELQKILYDEISNKSAIQGHDVSAYTSAIGHALKHKKVFLVLDDIDSIEQLNALLGKNGLFQGSKIIITAKNDTLTEKCALFEQIVPPKHKRHLLEILDEDASLKLLCKHAFKLETEFIKEIVTNINEQLRAPLRSTLPQDLIGMDDSIKSITSWLNDDGSSHTADVLTIWGMGGIGKTSLARLIYDVHSTKFKPSSFIGDISRKCKDKYNGLLELQKILYDEISNKSVIQGHDVSAYTSAIGHALKHKKVFLVLDDIDSIEQLNALLGKNGLFQGSKIIITAKNDTLTEKCALFEQIVPPKHKRHLLEILDEDASLKLLCKHAFKYEGSKEGYEEVVDNILKYCGGLPLALQLLGGLLHNEKVSYWEGCIKKLKKESDRDINKVLRMSYDSLPYEQDQELFKHIACFFVGEERDFSETILKACDMETQSGIKNLMDRCLLSIGLYNELIMHSLIQEMGRDVVRAESRNQPGMRSRIWCHEESFKVLKQKKGTDNVLGLTIDVRTVKKETLHGPFELKTDAFSNMNSLMILQLDYIQISGSYENFPEELRWLRMRGFPLKSLPLDFPMKYLVSLDMSYSNIESFDVSCSNPQPLEGGQMLIGSCSKDDKLLGSLKILNLSYCYKLNCIAGFCELPMLESLFLRNCMSLTEISESIDHCDELVFIDLSNCKEFIRVLPRTLAKLKKVEHLVLDGCNIGELAMEVVPRDSKSLAIYLPSSLVRLSLANNKLSNESFPMDFSCLTILTDLCLDDNPIVSMPNCVRSLPRLKTLSLQHCEMLVSIEHPPRTLKELKCQVLAKTIQDGCSKSSIQKISFDPEMSPLNFWFMLDYLVSSSIEIEGIIKIQPIACVDDAILCSLRWRNLEFIKKRRVGTHCNARGPEGSQTQMYYEFGIFSTIYGGKVMPTWIRRRSKGAAIAFTIPSTPKKLRGLNVCCVQTITFPYWRNCMSLTEISESIDHCDELVFIDLSNCKEFIRVLPRTLAKLKKVEHLVLDGCNIGELAMEVVPRDSKSLAIYLPSSLVRLSLANNKLSNESFPMDFSCLTILTDLCLDDNPIVSMPNCVRSLPRLKTLSLQHCEMLVSIEHPPRTLKELKCQVLAKTIQDGCSKSSIQKISFDPEMSPLNFWFMLDYLVSSSIEIEGIIKIQPIAGVDDAILCSLWWRNLEFIKKRRVGTHCNARGPEGSQTQMYYEFGIFSTIYGGKVMPTWIRRRSKGAAIAFTIPSTPKKLRGLNVCCVQTITFPYWRSADQDRDSDYPYYQLIYLPDIRISNITKNLTWIYKHYVENVNVGGKSLTFLSHWMFGKNEMEDGDQLTISIEPALYAFAFRIRECGVSFVYDDEKNEKEEDPLSYYKSWNHIIGGDLSPFQLETGEYNLQNFIQWYTTKVIGGLYKEKIPQFKAFSQKNSNTRGRAIEVQVLNTLLGGSYGFSQSNFLPIVKNAQTSNLDTIFLL
ncbi:toll/interleukin-1 receptor (TIR) domain-containing protein [Artemisia annua]|uniref:Toll/interleukin-1 receptor (TIR) domain-containing protein n=1 Tax=Artemisia annua TaxID=35608 RepID=A0A2U1MEI8_ARTAN|nr:toll/interleukin-1 receptor (TIR) domain-containing protein [Artemisia annua]